MADSPSDVPMLSVAGRRVFVGDEPPPGLHDAHHVPAADLQDVAGLLVADRSRG